MDLFDPVFLSRAQFTFAVLIHFIFVPLSVGLGLFMAIFITRAKRSGSQEHARQASFLVKLFTLVFVCGVATGITMEFSFGTNWADYSRFVGDIFGAPLAAEALFAFFLESVFLGVLIFGVGKVSKTFYTVSAWLVWCGSLLSALWILIANSWMQTPSGYVVNATTGKAQLTDFFAAAFNPQTIPTYLHTVLALIIMGAFVVIGVASFYKLRGQHEDFSKKAMRIGSIVALIAVVCMMPASHMQACVVAEYQPSKLAAMEGQYETKASDMTLFGFVDTQNKEVVGPSIPGLTSFLASGDSSKEYLGLDDLEAAAPGSTPSSNIVQATFVSYHFMIIMMGLIALALIAALIVTFKKNGNAPRLLLYFLRWAWIAPFIAIMTGWLTAEFGRQPWIVYGQLKTAEAYSQAVPAAQILITLFLFIVLYTIIVVAFVRMFTKFVHEGPKKGVDLSGENTPIAHVSKKQARRNIAAVQENDARLRHELAMGKNARARAKEELEENARAKEELEENSPHSKEELDKNNGEHHTSFKDNNFDVSDTSADTYDDDYNEDDPDNPDIPDEEKLKMKAAAKELELKPSEERLADTAQEALDNVNAAKETRDKHKIQVKLYPAQDQDELEDEELEELIEEDGAYDDAIYDEAAEYDYDLADEDVAEEELEKEDVAEKDSATQEEPTKKGDEK